MATDLHPTPTRLALLRDIADPDVQVYRCRRFSSDKLESAVKRPYELERKVTAQTDEMERAGWIRLGHADHPSMYAPRAWELTDLGRQVLAAADKEKNS